MKICIYGAGAIGGFLGVRLAQAGHDVSMIARGDHLAALRDKGCTLESGGERVTVHPECSDDPATLGPHDFVVVAVKAPALPSVLSAIGPLLGPETAVVTAMNGIPWWFFDGFGMDGRVRADWLDPDGSLAAAVPSGRIIGCVVHAGASVPEPGLIRHAADDRFLLGEASGEQTDRCRALADAITEAGLRGVMVDDIRREIWIKLLGNFNFGAISVLTGATNEQIATDPGIRKLCVETFEEAARVGLALGLEPGMDAEERIDLGGSLGAFKTSMLQDFTRGRPLEIDTITRPVSEFGRQLGIPTPQCDALLALLSQSARLAGLH